MTMLTPDDYCWRRGFPPDKDTTKWEVSFTVGGAVWHRRKRVAVEQASDTAYPGIIEG